MRAVEDDAGRRYLLVKRSTDAWLVRDPATGRESYRPAADLTVVDDDPRAVAAAGVPEPVRRVLTAVATERDLGLLVALVDRGPIPAHTLLAETDRCESDLTGLLGEFRAAGLATTATVAGEPGYDATDAARAAVATFRAGAGPDGEDPSADDGDGRVASDG
jgi:hypothetical protein